MTFGLCSFLSFSFMNYVAEFSCSYPRGSLEQPHSDKSSCSLLFWSGFVFMQTFCTYTANNVCTHRGGTSWAFQFLKLWQKGGWISTRGSLFWRWFSCETVTHTSLSGNRQKQEAADPKKKPKNTPFWRQCLSFHWKFTQPLFSFEWHKSSCSEILSVSMMQHSSSSSFQMKRVNTDLCWRQNWMPGHFRDNRPGEQLV